MTRRSLFALPVIVRRFRERYTHVEVTLHELTTMEQIKALKEGRIDVGFGRVKAEDPNVRRIVLREERLIVGLPDGHALSGSEEALRLVDLQNETLIVYPKAPRPSFADQVLDVFRSHGITPGKVVEVRELQIAVGMVAAGEGVAVVSESVHGMKRADVSYRPLADRQAVSPVMFSVRNLDKSEELRNMLAVIYEIYDEVGIPHVKETL